MKPRCNCENGGTIGAQHEATCPRFPDYIEACPRCGGDGKCGCCFGSCEYCGGTGTNE